MASAHSSLPALSPQIAAQVGRARKILLIRLRSLGDAVLMTPVPTALKSWRPEARISVLVEEPFAPVFRQHPAVDAVISLPRHASPVQRFQCLRQIRRERFDLVFDMHSGSTAGLLTVLSGAGVRIAYGLARYAGWCDVRVPESKLLWNGERVHTVEHQLSPLLYLGIPLPAAVELQVGLSGAAQQSAGEQMEMLKLEPGRYIFMSPFATLFTKEWAVPRFAELARRLREICGVPIVAAAGPAEREKLQSLVALSGSDIVGLPLMPLEELIVWIDRCGLYIGADSGPTHLAAARKKKIVVLWGSSDYHAWHPWATECQTLRADLPCMPCPGYRCYQYDSPRCIESIAVDQVLQAVEKLKAFS